MAAVSIITGQERDRMAVQKGNARYLHLLKFLVYLHIVKAYGYGTMEDPLNNLRASSRLGIEPWRGAYIRAEDKMNRILNLTSRGDIPSVGEREGVLDTMADKMAYDGLALALYSEEIGMTDNDFYSAFPIQELPKEEENDRNDPIDGLLTDIQPSATQYPDNSKLA